MIPDMVRDGIIGMLDNPAAEIEYGTEVVDDTPRDGFVRKKSVARWVRIRVPTDRGAS